MVLGQEKFWAKMYLDSKIRPTITKNVLILNCTRIFKRITNVYTFSKIIFFKIFVYNKPKIANKESMISSV